MLNPTFWIQNGGWHNLLRAPMLLTTLTVQNVWFQKLFYKYTRILVKQVDNSQDLTCLSVAESDF